MPQNVNLPIEAHRSSEGRFLLVWLPASLIAAAVLGWEAWFDAYYALAVLPSVPLVLAALFLKQTPSGSLRAVVAFLVPYLLLEWAAELYYAWHHFSQPGDPPIPSPADYCWLASYVFLTVGCWRAAFGRRGLPLQTKDAFIYGAWLVVATGIVTWLAVAVWRSHTALEALILGLYPFFDVVIISLLLMIRSRHRADTLRPFWTMLIFACLAMLGGDIMWLLSMVITGQEDLLVKLGDGGFIHAYLMFTAAIWIARLLERAQAGGAGLAQAEAAIRRNLAAGRLNALATAPIFVVIAGFILVEKGAEHFFSAIAGGGVISLLVAVAVALLLKGGAFKWEKRREAMSLYRDEFLRRLKDGVDQTAEDAAFFERLRAALHLSPGVARAIEGRVLREREDELRARLELLQQRSSERRSAEEWATAKSAWLGSIRELNLQIESQAGAGTARSGDDRPHG
jgi:hypothetical protein